MKFAVYLLLIGACALFAEATPISETASPEVEDAEVEVEPEFVVEPEVQDSKECPVESSLFFTCGNHNCSEMDLLESIMFALNDFGPYVNHKPDCPLAQPPPPPHPGCPNCPLAQPPHQPYPVCTDCEDSQFMILKVAGLLRSLADLLSLCGAPLPSCPHGAEPKFSEAPCPEAQPGPKPDPNFGNAEVEQFEKSLDAIVCAIMDQIHEEMESEEESAEEEAFEEMEEEEAKKELAEEEPAKEEEKSAEVVRKDLEVTPEEVETFNPEAENETTPAPRRSHKKSKKRKSKEPANEKVADEEQPKSSMMDGLMDVFNLSG